jgi:hypothetical protein
VHDIAFIESILNIIYPFVALYAWYSVHKHNRMIERKLNGTDSKVNGRLDELIAAKIEIAHRQGVEEGIALARKELLG